MTEYTNPPELICDVCDRPFKNKGALAFHKRTHEDSTAPDTEVVISDTRPALPVHAHTAPDHGHAHLEALPHITLKIKKLPHYGSLPDLTIATSGSAAIDLYAAIDDIHTLPISGWYPIPTGIAVEIPTGYCGWVLPRSGLAANHGITLLNSPGLIDSDYRGEIKAIVVNNTTSKFRIEPGMRIAQLLIQKHVIAEVEYTDALSDTERGTGGLGSTGR